MKILVINAGSSSLKYQLLDPDSRQVMAKGLCERIGIDGSRLNHQGKGEKIIVEQAMPDHAVAIELVIKHLIDAQCGVIQSIEEIDAVGHRVVHGGSKFTKSVLIDDQVKEVIIENYPLCPLHNPANIMGIEACQKVLPNKPQVAVFDTSFHQTMPASAYMYGLPYEVYQTYGVRRYGFHGTSHSFVSKRAIELLQQENSKIVVCHLGNGSSMSAVVNGKCVDTSMGLTPLAGCLMGTRCGDIDPAIVPFLMEQMNLDQAAIDRLMNKESGVAGISGVSSDFRDLAKAAEQGNERAALALNMFIYQCSKIVGSYAAAMGGLDALVFTAGIGENDAYVRAGIAKSFAFLGLELNQELNAQIHGKETIISTDNSQVKVMVIPTNEELAIALDTQKLVQ